VAPMAHPLWAPWRMEYILAPKEHKECIFCGIERADQHERHQRLVVCRTPRAYVMLNRYPFASGHILIIPYAHAGALEALPDDDYDALFRLVRVATGKLRMALKADGFNIGCNLGAVAGAGVAEHLHVHIVPRWSGDTNFMPAIADTRVIPQALTATRDHLEPYFAEVEGQPIEPTAHPPPNHRGETTP
jgi:ATP adenylyltransferase